jgi:hypothetical protein
MFIKATNKRLAEIKAELDRVDGRAVNIWNSRVMGGAKPARIVLGEPAQGGRRPQRKAGK